MARVLPHDTEAEKSVLGAMMLDQSAIDSALIALNSHDFYLEKHEKIFEAIGRSVRKDEEVTVLTVINELKKTGDLKSCGGSFYVTELPEKVISVGGLGSHIEIVRDKSVQRTLIENLAGIVNKAYDETADAEELVCEAEQVIFDLSEKKVKAEFERLEGLLSLAMERLDEAHKERKAVVGVPTGYIDLDEKLTGLHKGELIVLAGRPSMGKTALATNISINAAKQDVSVAIFSLESAKADLAQRILTSEAKVNSHLARSGKLSGEDFKKIGNAISDIYDLPVFVDDSPGLSVPEIRSKARRIVSKKSVGLLIIDYLNLIRTTRRYDTREREVADISQSMKSMARELNIPVILVCQLSRKVENRTDKRPQLSDLRESGAIEQDADVVLFVYREGYYDRESTIKQGKGEIIVAKQRNGPTGVVPISWLEFCTRFENYTPDF